MNTQGGHPPTFPPITASRPHRPSCTPDPQCLGESRRNGVGLTLCAPRRLRSEETRRSLSLTHALLLNACRHVHLKTSQTYGCLSFITEYVTYTQRSNTANTHVPTTQVRPPVMTCKVCSRSVLFLINQKDKHDAPSISLPHSDPSLLCTDHCFLNLALLYPGEVILLLCR